MIRGITEVSDGDGIGDIFIKGDGDVINGWIVVVIRFIDIRDVDGDGGRIGAGTIGLVGGDGEDVLSVIGLVIERFA